MKSIFKEPRLSVLFVGYLAVYGVSTLVLCGLLVWALTLIANTGVLLPSNVQEMALSQNMEKIQQAAPNEVGQYIPDGATYGIYDEDGTWLGGTLEKERRDAAWERYSLRESTPDDEAFYKYIPMADGKVCIARYFLGVRYTSESLNRYLPPPEHLLAWGMLLVALLNLLYLAHRFGRAINRRLETVQQVTAKIATHDLDFEVTQDTGIREINAVMASLGTLRDALKTSLTTQWQKEQQKNEQLAALAHDIKTPLTVIRGNAELLQEAAIDADSRDCADYIVENAEAIDGYLAGMRAVLHGEEKRPCEAHVAAAQVVGALKRTAGELTHAAKMPLQENVGELQGTLCLAQEDILRAWRNILDNAVTVTNPTQGIQCDYRMDVQNGTRCLVATVRDHGPGFSDKDLKHADEAFYIGDDSRHARNHQGLGLAIAKAAVTHQGGRLSYSNASGGGAQVSLWLKLDDNE